MKLSYRWLGEWVKLRLDARSLAQRLTNAGLEVGAIEPVAPALTNVVVGRIRAVAPHPNAAELKLCDVETARGKMIRVVCGAPNAAVGVRAPLALPGATLADGR